MFWSYCFGIDTRNTPECLLPSKESYRQYLLSLYCSKHVCEVSAFLKEKEIRRRRKNLPFASESSKWALKQVEERNFLSFFLPFSISLRQITALAVWVRRGILVYGYSLHRVYVFY